MGVTFLMLKKTFDANIVNFVLIQHLCHLQFDLYFQTNPDIEMLL